MSMSVIQNQRESTPWVAVMIFSYFFQAFRVVEFTSLGMALSERYWEVETNGELVVLWPGFLESP